MTKSLPVCQKIEDYTPHSGTQGAVSVYGFEWLPILLKDFPFLSFKRLSFSLVIKVKSVLISFLIFNIVPIPTLSDNDHVSHTLRPESSSMHRHPMKRFYFLRYTFNPTLASSCPGMTTLPSVEAIMIVLPEADGPNSFDRSILIVRMFVSIDISTFFIFYLPTSSPVQSHP